MRWKVLAAVALAGATLITGFPTAPNPGGVTVRDIQIAVPGQPRVHAYVVAPANRAHALAGLLYLHWLEPGALNQNRTEFLAEAVTEAGRGAVAVLPDLVFPWNNNVVGTAQHAASVRAQLFAVTRAYQMLLA